MGRRVEALSTGRVCRASPVCNRATPGYAISVGSVRVSYPLAVGRPGRFNLRPIPGCMSPQPHSVTLDPGEPRSRCISLQGVPFEPCPVVVWMRRVCGMTAAPVPSRPCQLSGALARPSRSSPPRVAIWPPNVPSVVWPSRGRRGAHREASGAIVPQGMDTRVSPDCRHRRMAKPRSGTQPASTRQNGWLGEAVFGSDV